MCFDVGPGGGPIGTFLACEEIPPGRERGEGCFCGPILCSLPPIPMLGAFRRRRKYPKADPAIMLLLSTRVKVERMFWLTHVLKAVSLVVSYTWTSDAARMRLAAIDARVMMLGFFNNRPP